MKKKLLSIIVAALICVTSLGAFGCNRPDNGGLPTGDPNKTWLFVYNYNGGVGTDWLYEIEKSFEEKYKDTIFEPDTNKKGVDIVISPGKDNMTGSLRSQVYDVIFSEIVPYNDMAAQGSLLPLTDMVKSSLSDVTDGKETVTIESKLTTSQKAALTAINDEYYVLPHYEVYSGLTYDAKVFSDWQLYFKAGGGWTSEESEKSVGPDGIKGSYDDGLPSSIEELMTLMDRSSKFLVAPFIWTGAYESYTSRLLVGLHGALAGHDEFMLNYNYGKDSGVNGGKARIITGFNGTTPIVQEMDITPETGYLLKQQESKYYALKVLEKILSNSKYYSSKITGVLDHESAQTEYIYADLENNPVAMLIEGSYWYNEAKDSRKRSENTYKEKAKNRQFKWMPLPTQVSGSVTEGNGKKQTLVDSISSYAYINANNENDPIICDLAKTFLKYCYSEEALQNFVLQTGVFKGVSVNMDNVDISGVNSFYQSIINVRKNADVAYPVSDNKIYMHAFVNPLMDWQTVVDGVPYDYPIDGFQSRVSAEKYFKGMWSNETSWKNAYKDYFN